MGMYDDISVLCECGEVLNVQSKAGPCRLNVYSLETAPPHVLADLAGRSLTCRTCGRTCVIRLHFAAWADWGRKPLKWREWYPEEWEEDWRREERRASVRDLLPPEEP